MAFAWLSQAEINASWLKSFAAQKAAEAVPGLEVSLGDIRAQRIPWRNSIRITVTRSRVRYNELAVGTVGRLVVELDGPSLLNAEPRLRTLSLEGVDATVRWNLEELRTLLEQPSEGPPTLPWLDGLEAAAIDGARVRFVETATAVTHVLTLAQAEVEAAGADLRLSADARLDGPDNAAEFEVDGTGKANGPWQATATVESDGVSGLIGPLLPTLAKNRVDLPVRIQARIRADETVSTSADLAIRKGRVTAPKLWRRPLGVRAAKSHLVWDGGTKTLSLSGLAVNLDGVHVTGRAVWPTATGAEARRRANLSISHIGVDDLRRLWPSGAAEGGRRWVERNVTDGRVPKLNFTYAHDGRTPKLGLNFRFEDLRVFYRRPMPPAEHAYGRARLIGSVLRFDIEKAQINDLDMSGSSVRLTNLGIRNEQAVVDAVGQGPIVNLLEVLDSEPLGYISAFGLKPSDVAGTMRMTGTLSVPLRSNVTFDDVQFTGRAKGKDVALPDVLDTHDLTRGDVVVAVTRQGLVAEGTADIGPQAVELTWRESFSLRDGPPSTYIINAHTDADRLRRLGYGIGDLVEGPMTVRLDLVGRGQTIERGFVKATLNDSVIDLRNLGIRKRVGEPGEAGFSLRRVEGRYLLDDVTVSTPRFSISGKGVIDPLNRSRQWILDQVNTPYYLARADVLDVDNKPMQLAIEGETLNLKPIIEGAMAPPVDGDPLPATTPWPDLVGSGRFQKVLLFNDQVIEGASVAFETRDNLLSFLKFSGKLDGTSTVLAGIDTQDGARAVYLEAANAGRLARSLDLYTNGSEGSLLVDAKVRGTGRTMEFDGIARMRNFRIAEAPILAKMLGFASLTGLRDTLYGRGILFETATVPFKLRGGVVSIEDASIIGPALGITLEGQFQQSLRKAHFRGVLVPSYTLNSLIGKIPLLGRLVVGGKDQGLIGFNYRVEGELRDPAIAINPVSGLTPGFLRLLLAGEKALVSPDEEEAVAAPQVTPPAS